MKYSDISTTDSNFNEFISFGDYNSTLNFYFSTNAEVDNKPIDLNDNEYIRIRVYSLNEKF